MNYQKESPTKTDQEPNPTPHILAVDDNHVARESYERFLPRFGNISVTSAESASQALELLAQPETPFDLILTDFNMPQMDGAQLIAAIREQDSYSQTPIILFTNELISDIPNSETLFNDHTRFLDKTVSLTTLAEIINSLLSAPEPSSES